MWSQPSPIFFRIKGGQAGVAEGNPAAGGNAVGDVGDFAGVKLVEVFQGGLLQQFGVEGGDPIDGVAADTGQVGHAHVAPAGFVNQRQGGELGRVVEVLDAYLVHKPLVDFKDDFQVAGQ